MSEHESSLRPPLDEYLRQLEILKDDARELTEGLSLEQLNWAPAPGSWSIAQCLAHLNRVDAAYAESVGRGLEAAREKGQVISSRTASKPLRYNLFERWFIRAMEPPPKRRLPAPKTAVVAAVDHSLDEVLPPFLANKDRFIDLLRQAEDVDLNRVKIPSPLAKFLKFRIGAVFAFTAAHNRRHLWQAQQIRQHPEFPPSS